MLAMRFASCSTAAGLAVVLLLEACSTPQSPRSGAAGAVPVPAATARPGSDGPPIGPAPDPLQVPDAEPRVESIRPGGPNKPYEVAGQTYVPQTSDEPTVERGLASWYGRKFHGRRTASGERYDMNAMTAAHRTLPIPSYARVRNPANGREVIVRINDRGPFAKGRIIDLSWVAAVKLGVQNGVQTVEVQHLSNEEIRAGLARRGDGALAQAAPSRAPEPVTATVAALPDAAARPVFSAAEARPVADAVAPQAQDLPAVPAPGPAAEAPPPASVEAAAVASEPDAAREGPAPAPGFWLQLGAFAHGEGAQGFRQRVAAELGWLAPMLSVFGEPGGLQRLQAGPYASREQAREVAQRVRLALQLVPVLVERR
jgi:rare lipoprotein A